MKFLKNHPFPVVAHFEKSLVLTFAVPKEELLSFIPECLTLDTFQDKWAFIAIALVQTKGLRPKGFPSFLGNDFFLIGYRIFVRFKNDKGRNLRGLYIIKSETNKKKMQFFGNIFTHYNYTTTDINIDKQSHEHTFHSSKSNFFIKQNITSENPPLPIHSPFDNWKEARRFAGPLPFTFTFNKQENSVLIIEGVRSNWKPNPVAISDFNFDFLNQLNLNHIVLANAFEITDIPYQWKKGKKENWNK